MTAHILDRLHEILKSRKTADPAQSYVASLYDKGTETICRKVMEEATEAIIEALNTKPENLKEESADLLFHLMILWSDQGIEPGDVFTILENRFGTSGIDEKKSR